MIQLENIKIEKEDLVKLVNKFKINFIIIIIFLINLCFLQGQDQNQNKVFISDIKVVGNQSFSEQQIFLFANLFPKDRYEDVNSNNVYDFEMNEPFFDFNNNGYYYSKGSFFKSGDEIKTAINRAGSEPLLTQA